MQNRLKLKLKFLGLAFGLAVLVFAYKPSEASIIDTLKEKIQSRSEDIEKIKQEITIYQKELENTAIKAKSLTEDIKTLTTTKKKLEGDINVTEKNINKTTLTIKEIESDIVEKEEKITYNKLVIEKMLRNLQQESGNSLIEAFLQDKSLSMVGEYLDHTEKFEQKIQEQIQELLVLKEELADRKEGALNKKKDLSNFKKELSGKKQAVVETQTQKDKILKQTKNQQTEYQKVLAEKIRLKEQFEKEIFEFESQLKLSVDPNKLPGIGLSVLSWPLDSVRITQYFGATVDAKKLYVSGSHNGIDFGAPDGTKVKSALSGTVWATGNTDINPKCYSYGKWVLVKHNNGLSTLYAHLSVISVNPGDTVATGDIIGFSGRTGYSTGPHLHLTVYATEGVRVQLYTNSINCKNVTIPVADPKAYLDPILYLPKL